MHCRYFYRVTYWVLIQFACMTYLHAQDAYYHDFTVTNGLPSNMVMQIIQDKDGFIWMGTGKGACRFDGNTFEVFDSRDGIGGNSILGMVQDQQNRIWFLTMSGDVSFYLDGRIYNSDNFGALNNIHLDGPIFYGLNDSLGNTWLVGDKVLKIQGDNFQVFDRSNLLEAGVCINNFDNLLFNGFIDSGGLLSFIDDNHQIWNFVNKPVLSKKSIQSGNPELIYHYYYSGSSNAVYLYSEGIIYALLEDDLVEKLKLERGVNISRITEDEAGNFLISTNKGLFIYNSKFEKVDYILKNLNTTNCIVDKEGNKWVGTMSDGLLFIPNTNIKIYPKTFFDGNKITRIVPWKKGHLGATQNGDIYEFNALKSTLIYRPKAASIPMDLTVRGNNYYYIMPHEFKVGGRINVHHTHGGIKSIYIDEMGKIFLGGWLISSYDANGRFIRSTPNLGIRIYGLVTTSKGFILGTEKGLYNCIGDSLIKFNEHQISASPVAILKKGADGILWGGTMNHGIFGIYNDSIYTSADFTNLFTDVTKLSVFNNKVFFIYEGQVYYFDYTISSSNNLLFGKVNLINSLLKMHVYGLSVDDNYLWVASESGVIQFPIDFLNRETKSSQIAIKRILINHVQQQIVSEYECNYYENNLQIEVASISYRQMGAARFRYRVDKGDSVWYETDNSDLIFPNLAPGVYEICIQVQNSDLSWNESGLTIRMIIHPPVWKNPGVLLFSFILFLGAGFVFVRRRIYTLKQENRIIQESLQSELMALRSQTNPHFIFNVLSSLQYMILQGSTSDAGQFLSKFAQLIRKTLYMSRRETVAIEEEVQFLSQYLELEHFRSDGKFSYEIYVSEEIRADQLEIPALLLQPFVENTLKHGLRNSGDGHIQIRFLKKEDNLLVHIEDNGKGIRAFSGASPNEGEHVSVGMVLVKKQIEKLNASKRFSILLNIRPSNPNSLDFPGTLVELKYIHIFRDENE